MQGYAGHIILFAIACFCMATPWLTYYDDNRAASDARSQEKSVENNAGLMADRYHIDHSPLYLGVRMPTAADIYPVLPVVFEHTPVSVKLTDDGFWLRAYWNQLTATLSILTYHMDASSVYTFTGDPITKPLEAVLVILGIAWAAWRWRDTRMAVLSIWFWATIIAGGVLTIDAPYAARLVGIIPCMAIFAAIVVNKLAAEFMGVASRVILRPVVSRRMAVLASSGALLALLGYLTVLNFNDYFVRYLDPHPFNEVTGQAYFVRQMNKQATDEGRPTPMYYDLGAQFIFWTHGDNRFLNNGTNGRDMSNPADSLPLLDNDDRDAVFMIWPVNMQYLPILKAYYPNGKKASSYMVLQARPILCSSITG